jgi:hypothetical protein
MTHVVAGGERDEQRERELAGLRYHWAGAYAFGYDHGRWWARRADTGAMLCHPDLDTFRRAIRLDYIRRPVPRAADDPGGR